MVQQGVGGGGTFRQFGTPVGVHHTVNTWTCEGYRLHGTPSRRHAGDRQRVATPTQDRFMAVQALRAKFSVFEMTLLIQQRSVFSNRRYLEGCIKIILRSRRPYIRTKGQCVSGLPREGVYWAHELDSSLTTCWRTVFLVINPLHLFRQVLLMGKTWKVRIGSCWFTQNTYWFPYMGTRWFNNEEHIYLAIYPLHLFLKILYVLRKTCSSN
jgi:hypothetical protein